MKKITLFLLIITWALPSFCAAPAPAAPGFRTRVAAAAAGATREMPDTDPKRAREDGLAKSPRKKRSKTEPKRGAAAAAAVAIAARKSCLRLVPQTFPTDDSISMARGDNPCRKLKQESELRLEDHKPSKLKINSVTNQRSIPARENISLQTLFNNTIAQLIESNNFDDMKNEYEKRQHANEQLNLIDFFLSTVAKYDFERCKEIKILIDNAQEALKRNGKHYPPFEHSMKEYEKAFGAFTSLKVIIWKEISQECDQFTTYRKALKILGDKVTKEHKDLESLGYNHTAGTRYFNCIQQTVEVIKENWRMRGIPAGEFEQDKFEAEIFDKALNYIRYAFNVIDKDIKNEEPAVTGDVEAFFTEIEEIIPQLINAITEMAHWYNDDSDETPA